MKKVVVILMILSVTSFVAQVKFSDQANSLGINFGYGAGVFGGGVSFSDYNQDGWDDLTFATELNKPIEFYKNVNGSFVKDNLVDMYPNLGEHKQVIWVDFDNDGDKDLFVTVKSGDTKLYQNDGNLVLTDITTQAGLTHTGESTWGASWGDYNHDGFLDVYINFLSTGNTQPNRLFKNNGDGTFTDVTSGSGLNTEIDAAFCSAFFDYNNDGHQDLYVTNHKYEQSYLYQNNGDGTFTDVSVQTYADVFADGMSTAIGDYNNDGFFDIYITNSAAGNILLRNNNGTNFLDTADQSGTEFENVSWGAVFLDGNNDGLLDLYVSGQEDGTDGLLPSAYYQNGGLGMFFIPNNAGFENDKRRSFANAIGDTDNDGFPEIVVINEQDDNFLWKNETTDNNSWIKIKLEGVSSNKDGIGNKIEVFADGELKYGYTTCGEGYLSQSSDYKFFGLLNATTIDYIKIYWNKEGTVETINNVDVNQSITIQEGNGILSTNKVIKAEDFVSAYPNPSSDVFTINTKAEIQKIEVFNLLGKSIVKQKEKLIDLKKFDAGVYIVKVFLNNSVKELKLIKQ